MTMTNEEIDKINSCSDRLTAYWATKRENKKRELEIAADLMRKRYALTHGIAIVAYSAFDGSIINIEVLDYILPLTEKQAQTFASKCIARYYKNVHVHHLPYNLADKTVQRVEQPYECYPSFKNFGNVIKSVESCSGITISHLITGDVIAKFTIEESKLNAGTRTLVMETVTNSKKRCLQKVVAYTGDTGAVEMFFEDTAGNSNVHSVERETLIAIKNMLTLGSPIDTTIEEYMLCSM